MIGHFLMSFLALHPKREQCVQSLSEADRRVAPVAKIVPGAALIISWADRIDIAANSSLITLQCARAEYELAS